MKPNANNKLLESILEFYKDDNNLKLLIDIIVNKSIPLRIFEWFVTNYTKKFNINYSIIKPDINNVKIKNFNVYQSYESQMKACQKKEFDPNCRVNGTPILFEYIDSNTGKCMTVETSIAQLNFFRWAIKNLIIDYIKKNYDYIYKDMDESRNNKQKSKGKKCELSKSIYKNMIISMDKKIISI